MTYAYGTSWYCEMYASHLQTYVDVNLSARAPFAMLRRKQSYASDVPSDWLALRWFVRW